MKINNEKINTNPAILDGVLNMYKIGYSKDGPCYTHINIK